MTVPAARVAQTPLSVRLTSLVGWILLGCGAGVLLYLAYALLFTNVGAERAQGELRAQWQQQIDAAPRQADPHADDVEPRAAAVEQRAAIRDERRAAPRGDGMALIEFVRPGSDQPLIHDEPLVVLDSVATDALAKGPGHYPDTALPGAAGNFSVAGHRTTYGAPFFHLDRLRNGDRILVTDRDGASHTYEVARQHVVSPGDSWVIGEDPLGTGTPTMTLTTCNPRFSAAERLVVHAELVS